MLLWKTVEKTLAAAAIGLAITGVAVGQVDVPGAESGAGLAGKIGANGAANATAPPVNAGTSADVNANSNVGTVPSGQLHGLEEGVDAAARMKAQSNDANIRSNSTAGVDPRQNRNDISQASNGAANVRTFGATFDSAQTDRLIIRDLQPNSAATRLGLQSGDRIIDIDGQTYTDADQLDRDLSQLNTDTDVPITYERNGQRFTQRFRMSQSNGQQAGNAQTYGNQGWNGQSGQFGQASHSGNRPVYGVSAHNGYAGGMHQGQGYMGATNGFGSGSNYASICCSSTMQTQHSYSGHRHHRQNYGGRRHRNGCR